MSTIRCATLLLLVLALVSSEHLWAHQGHDHKVMGTVTMAAADHIMVKDTDGKDVALKVTKDTRVKAKPAIKVESIKVGTRVVVTAAEQKDGTMVAKLIELGASPAGN